MGRRTGSGNGGQSVGASGLRNGVFTGVGVRPVGFQFPTGLSASGSTGPTSVDYLVVAGRRNINWSRRLINRGRRFINRRWRLINRRRRCINRRRRFVNRGRWWRSNRPQISICRCLGKCVC